MSLTYGTTSNTTQRRSFTPRFMAVTLGMGLIVAALAAIALWQNDEPTTSSAGTTHIVLGPQEDSFTQFIYYLVDSEDQRNAVLNHEADISAAAVRENIPNPRRDFRIFLAPTGEEERVLGEAVREIMMSGNGAQLLDLRSAALP